MARRRHSVAWTWPLSPTTAAAGGQRRALSSASARPTTATCLCRPPPADSGRALVVPMSEVEVPGVDRATVHGTDVPDHPLDLGGGAGLPVVSRARHLRSWESLRNTISQTRHVTKTAPVVDFSFPATFRHHNVVEGFPLLAGPASGGYHRLA